MTKKIKSGLPRSIGILIGRSMRLASRDRKPRLLEIELTDRCAGGCNYCYASSRPTTDKDFLDADVARRVLDDASEMGMRMIWWLGGDPLYHPQWAELVRYAARLRMAQVVTTSGLISKNIAEQLVELKDYLNVSVHLDTVDPEAYAQINRRPATLKGRMRGYETLLAAGFPKNQVVGYVTLVKPVIDSFERTLDWFDQKMGTGFLIVRIFKPLGMGQEVAHLEPSLEEIKRCIALRDARYGIEMPPCDISPYICRVNVGVHTNGEVVPCLLLFNQNLGNVHEERFSDIVAKQRDHLFFNYELEGPCSVCDYHHDPEVLCIGCRVNALAYTGNIRASDPKCWHNPEAPMCCLS